MSAVALGSVRLRERALGSWGWVPARWGSGMEAPVLGKVPWRRRGGCRRQLGVA